MTARNSSAPQSAFSAPSPVSAPFHGKERGSVPLSGKEVFTEISQEINPSPEEKKAGVFPVKAVIDLPPDVKKLGVTHAGPNTPVSSSPPTVSLPISDDQILQGVNAPLSSAIKWLSVWCTKILHKSRLTLKKIHGKIVRVSY